MLELNKEYTYSQICEIIGWKVYSGGNVKKAQIKEIESCFEFYHPENKKWKINTYIVFVADAPKMIDMFTFTFWNYNDDSKIDYSRPHI